MVHQAVDVGRVVVGRTTRTHLTVTGDLILYSIGLHSTYVGRRISMHSISGLRHSSNLLPGTVQTKEVESFSVYWVGQKTRPLCILRISTNLPKIFTRYFAYIKATVYTEYIHSRFSNFISCNGAIWRILTISVTAACSTSQMKMLNENDLKLNPSIVGS